MDSDLVPAYFTGLIILAILILLVVIASRREKMRIQFLHSLASRLGLQSYDKDKSVLPGGLRNIPLYVQGKKRKVMNVMQGTREGALMSIFDFSSRVGQGKLMIEQVQTVACFEKEGMNLPGFSMRPVGSYHEIPLEWDYVDVDFSAAHPGFAKGFAVKGKDEAAVRAMFTEQVIEHYTRIRGIAVEGEGNVLVCFRPGQQRRPEDLHAFRDNGGKILLQFMAAAEGAGFVGPVSVAEESAGAELGGEGEGVSDEG
ncbi:MAG: hypothetical protein AAF591_14285 [Verrucomicrobiota bacterium]